MSDNIIGTRCRSWGGGLKRFARILLAAPIYVCALSPTAGYAADAKITDVSGQSYDVKSLRFTKGFSLPFIKEPKFDVNCDGARITQPLKNVKNMRINPAKISSIDGQLHFGVEILLKDSSVIGNISDGRCFIPADNGFAGKSAKGKIAVPFEKIGAVYILGKEDKEAKKGKGKKDAGKGGEEPGGEESKPEEGSPEEGPPESGGGEQQGEEKQ